jgi:hypothetical protein
MENKINAQQPLPPVSCSTAQARTATCRRIDLMQSLAKETRKLIEVGKEEDDEKLMNLGAEVMNQIIMAL